MGMQVVGAMNKADTEKSVLGYESAVARNNQTISNYQAQIAEEVGQRQAQASMLKTSALMGEQRATLAANGVDLGSGSASEILATTKFMGERDALTIQDDAARRAWALREQGKGYGAEAGVDSALGSAIDPTVAGLTSLISGAGTVAGSWYRYRQATSNGVGGSGNPG
jgi:hypothetical protein